MMAGFYLHFSNLQGAVYLAEDEARPFALLSSGPLMYLMGRPIYEIFREQSAVFYLCGALGFLSIPLFALTARILAGPAVAAAAVWLFAVWPLRINYARTLFPSVFVEFFFLLSLLCLTVGLRRRNFVWPFAAGCFAALIFFVHSYGYALIGGLFLFVVACVPLHRRLEVPGNAWSRPALFVFAGILTSALMYGALYLFFDKYDYLQMTFGFQDYTKLWSVYEIGMFEMLFRQMTHPPLSAILNLSSLAGLVWIIFRVAGKRDMRLLLFAVPFLSGLSALVIFTVLKTHTLYDRHCVWLIPLGAVGIAGALDALKRRGGWKFEWPARVAMVALVAVMAADSYAVTRETFSVLPVRNWLREHGIVNRQVITAWWQINARDIPGPTIRVPGGLMQVSTGDSASWQIGESGRKALHYRINWTAVLDAYQKSGRRYLLTSGIDLQASLGSDEPLLAHVEPLQSWPHPYAIFKRRPYAHAQRTIRLYDLRDVFSRKNAETVRRSKQQNLPPAA